MPYAHERELGVFWMKTDWTHEEVLTHTWTDPAGSGRWRSTASGDAVLRAGSGPARLVPGVSAS